MIYLKTPLSNWMDSMWYLIKDKPISFGIQQLYTHVSGAYVSVKEAFNVEQLVAAAPSFANVVSYASTAGADAIYDLAVKAYVPINIDIYTQLNYGIRYLDLRFIRSYTDGKVRIFHGIFGPTVEEIFSQINNFLTQNPTEIITINLNSDGYWGDFYNDPAGLQELSELYQSYLGKFTILKESNIYLSSAYSDIQAINKNIILFTGSIIYKKFSQYGLNYLYTSNTYDNYAYTFPPAITDLTTFSSSILPLNYKDYESFLAFYKLNPNLISNNILYHHNVNSLMYYNFAELRLNDPDSFNSYMYMPSVIEACIASSDTYKTMLTDIGDIADVAQPTIFIRNNPDIEEIALVLIKNLGKDAGERMIRYKELLSSTDPYAIKLVAFYNSLLNIINSDRYFSLFEEAVPFNISASSTLPNYPVWNIADSDYNSKWSAGDNSFNQSIILKLAKDNNNFIIRAINLDFQYNERIYTFDISYSLNDAYYLPIIDEYNNKEIKGKWNMIVPPTNARTIKLEISSVSNGSLASVRNFKIYGYYDNPSPVVKMTDGFTNAPTSLTYPASYAIDSNPRTRWSALDGGLYSYTIKFDKIYDISYIRTVFELATINYRYIFQGSIDDNVYFDANPTRSVVNNSIKNVQCDYIGARIKYLKISFTALLGGAVASIFDLKAYGNRNFETQLEDGVYKIIPSYAKTKVVQVQDSNDKDFAKVNMWDDLNTDNQKWRITQIEDGFYTLSPVFAPTKFLDVNNSQTTMGLQLQINSATNTSSQKFIIFHVGYGYAIRPACAQNFVLDVSGGVTNNGAPIIQWTETLTFNQLWFLDLI